MAYAPICRVCHFTSPRYLSAIDEIPGRRKVRIVDQFADCKHPLWLKASPSLRQNLASFFMRSRADIRAYREEYHKYSDGVKLLNDLDRDFQHRVFDQARGPLFSSGLTSLAHVEAFNASLAAGEVPHAGTREHFYSRKAAGQFFLDLFINKMEIAMEPFCDVIELVASVHIVTPAENNALKLVMKGGKIVWVDAYKEIDSKLVVARNVRSNLRGRPILSKEVVRAVSFEEALRMYPSLERVGAQITQRYGCT